MGLTLNRSEALGEGGGGIEGGLTAGPGGLRLWADSEKGGGTGIISFRVLYRFRIGVVLATDSGPAPLK